MSKKKEPQRMNHEKKSKGLVPRLRFPEFRDAGEWEVKNLGEVGEIVTGKTPSTSDKSLWNGDIQFVTPTDIKGEKYQWQTQRSVVGNTATRIIPKHSTMFTCIASIGKMSLSVHPCITNQQINTIIPNKNYESEFVFYSLMNVVPLIKDTQTNAAFPIINKTEFSKFTLPIPTFPEQKKIADCLSFLDELITAEAQKIDTFKAHKKGLMQQLFPAEGETVPGLRFPEFRDAGEWVQQPIGYKVDLLSGYPFKSSEISEDSNGISLMRGINVTEGYVRHRQDIDRFFTKNSDTLKRYQLNKNDLVIGMDGSKVGKNSALITKKDAGSLLIQRVARLRTNCKATIQFIFQQINSEKFHSYVDRINTSGGIPHISAKQINDFEVCFPSLPEQQKIADCLSSLDELITAEAQKIDTLKAHKKGLMQGLFPSADEVDA